MAKAGLIREGVIYLERNIAVYEKAGQPLGWLRKAAAENWYLLGQKYLEHNQNDAAQNAFAQAIERKPDYLVAYISLAEMFLAHKQADQALTVLDHAKLIDLKNSHVWQLISQAHQIKGDTKKAHFYAQQARALSGT